MSVQMEMEYFNSEDFANHIDEILEQWHVPGLAIAIAHGTTTASKGFGNATLDPPVPCTADTLFDIASASKSLTAAAVGLLVDDEETYPNVQWDAKMSHLLPEDFVMSQDSYTRDVTVEDILSHRSGLPSHDHSYLSIRATDPDSPQSVTRNLRNLSIVAPIRTKYMYCNMMYTVATHLVESLTGETFESFLRRRFFEPLGMKSTNLQPNAAIDAGLGERMAMPYEWTRVNARFITLEHDQTPEAQGAGSIITSVNDYIEWVKEIMNHDSGKVIHEGVYRELVRPRIITNPEDSPEDLDPFSSYLSYAAGWETFYYRGYQIVQHDGLINGFASSHFFIPAIKFGAVMFSNAGEASASVVQILLHELIDEALRVPREERPDWNAKQRADDEKFDIRQEEEYDELRKELCPDGVQQQKTPLSAYLGDYWNAGYHALKVQLKDGRLFIAGSDRTMGFYIHLEHLCDQSKYIAHCADWMNPTDQRQFRAEFQFDEDEVTRLGLHLESDSDLIWFDRMRSTKT